MKETTIQTTTELNGTRSTDVGMEFSKVTAVGIGVTAAFIGGWALICLTSGMIAGGGPVAMVTSWFRAVIG